jgi:large subunit ribosomal protein L24
VASPKADGTRPKQPAAKIKKGDQVVVITGKNRRARGAVLSVDRNKARVTVERVNVMVKHKKPSATGAGGRIERENPIAISNVMLLHKGEPTRVGFRVVDGKKVRWSVRHNEAIDG